MIISDSIHNRSTGNPISGATVELFLRSTDVSLGTTTTNSKGEFTFTLAANPGPTYYSITIGGVTQRHSTIGIQPVRDLDLSALVSFQKIWRNGVLPDGLGVTANGSNLVLTVAAGSAIVDGQPVHIASSQTKTVTTAHPSSPRLDLLYLAVYNSTSSDMGKAEVILLAGTPSSTPAVPIPTIPNGNYIELASIRVDAGVTSIASSGKVSDLRQLTRPVTGGIVLEDDNVLKGTISGIDVKQPLYTNYYANEPADIGIYRGAVTPIRDASLTSGLSDISTSTETKLDEIDQAAAQPLMLNQTFQLIAKGTVNGEGVTALVDGQIGIKVGAAAVSYSPAQRWEHGVDTTHFTIHKQSLTGTGAKVPVEVWWKRTSTSGTFSPGVVSIEVDFTPTFTAGT